MITLTALLPLLLLKGQMRQELAESPTIRVNQQTQVQELERSLRQTVDSMRRIRIDYSVSQISLVDGETLECEKGLKVESMAPRVETILFEGDPFYFSTRAGNLAHSEGSLAEVWFDGSVLYMGTGGEMVAILDEQARKKQMRDKTRLYSSAYCDSLGMEVPNTCEELGETVSSRIAAAIKSGGSHGVDIDSMDADNLRLTIRSSRETHVYNLIPTAGYAVREMARFMDGQLREHVVASSHKRLTEKLWLPLSVQRYEYHSSIQYLPLIVEEIMVTSMEVDAEYPENPMEALRPGAIIADSRWSSAPTANGPFLNYVLPMPIEKVEQEFAKGMLVNEKERRRDGKPRQRQLAALISGVLVGVALNTISRKRRKSLGQSATIQDE